MSQNGKYTIKHLEPLMIKRLSPILNTSYNLNPGVDSMPKTEKEKNHEKLLDKIYRDIFEKKK